MRKNPGVNKIISALLCLCMLLQNVPVGVLAAEGDCTHHPQHTEECGYEEGLSDCTFQCGECAAAAIAQEPEETTVPETTQETVSETTDVTEPTTEVTEPSTEATEPSTEATEPSTEATEPVTEPTVPETSAPTEATEPEPVCACETDDPACHATNCPCYEVPENPQCFCAEKCSEPNVWCDVCGFDISKCGGEDTAAAFDAPCDHSVTATLGYVSGSGTTNTLPAEADKYLLDGDPSTKWCGVFKGYENYVIFTTGGPSVLTSYTLTTGGDTGSQDRYKRNWTAWTLYGSNRSDGDWTVINQVTGANLPQTDSTVSAPFVVNPHTPYTHYKLVVNAIVADVTSHQMADITFQKLSYPNGVCSKCPATCPHGVWEDGNCVICGTSCSHADFEAGICTVCGSACSHNYIAGFCTACGMEHDHTGESFVNGVYPCGYACSHIGVLSLQHEYGSNSTIANRGSECILDGDPNTRWTDEHPKRKTIYEVFSTVGTTVLKSYTLTVADSRVEARYWTSWTLYGSHNKNEDWVKINQVVDTTLVVDSNNVSQIFMVEPHIPYPYYKLVLNDIASDNLNEHHQLADFTITGYCFNNGTCTTCGYRHSEHSYTNGYCNVCLLKHDHTTVDFTDGKCAICHYICPHKAYDADRNCSVCGSACAHAEYENSICKACGYECDHITAGYEDGFCSRCGTEHDHDNEGYINGVRPECGYRCSHEAVLTLNVVEGSKQDNGFDGWPSYLVDGDPDTTWAVEFKKDGETWVIFTAGEAAVMKSYTLTMSRLAATLPENNWKSWTIYGKNGEEEWTRIHVVKDAQLPEIPYAVTGPYVPYVISPYSQYKLVVNDIVDSSAFDQYMGDITITGFLFKDGSCSECGYNCQNHTYSGGACSVCGFVCSHESFNGSVCNICKFDCPHANIGTDGKCTVCKSDCPHEIGYDENDCCKACGTPCDHQKEGYSDTGFCKSCDQAEQPAPPENGVYKISKAGHLYWFADQVNSGKTGINGELTCNIDLKANTPTGGNWSPMGSTGGPYQGTLDGKGHTIDNVKIWEEEYVGFICAIGPDGVVKNLGLGQHCSISGYEYTGGICGKNDGLIEGCWYRGRLSDRAELTHNDSYIGGTAGGIAGENNYIIRNCWFDGQMNDNGDDGDFPCTNGGIVGDNTDGTVENCYNVGIVYGWQVYGGIVGQGGTVKHCYAHIPMKKAPNNSLCGETSGIGGNNITNSYLKGDISHDAFSTGELAYTLQQGTGSDKLIWGQNLDNGNPRDDHPTLAYHGAPRVYQVKDCKNNIYYSNANINGNHRVGTDGTCTVCGEGLPEATVVTAPVAKELTYTGQPQTLVTAGSAQDGTMRYSLDNTQWSVDIPTGQNAGSYTVYYKVSGDSNHKDNAGSSVTVTIAPKSVTEPVIEGIEPQYPYTGEEITPVPTAVKDGDTLIDPGEYTVDYEDNISEGTATVEIVDKDGGNYIVNGSKTFQIVRNQIAAQISWGGMAFTYTEGSWNPQNHTYGEGEWTADSEEGNQISISNQGDAPVKVNLSYTAADTFTDITGSFTDSAGKDFTEAILNKDESGSYFLALSGKPDQSFSNTALGIVTVSISNGSQEGDAAS